MAPVVPRIADEKMLYMKMLLEDVALGAGGLMWCWVGLRCPAPGSVVTERQRH
jgi:hypothetical protein